MCINYMKLGIFKVKYSCFCSFHIFTRENDFCFSFPPYFYVIVMDDFIIGCDRHRESRHKDCITRSLTKKGR